MKPEEIDAEQFARLVKLERYRLFDEWLNEWGYSVRDCLKEQSDMFKPCVEQLEHLLDDKWVEEKLEKEGEVKISRLFVAILIFEGILLLNATSFVYREMPKHQNGETWGWGAAIGVVVFIIIPTAVAYICGRMDSMKITPKKGE